jgi:hypothetical protein
MRSCGGGDTSLGTIALVWACCSVVTNACFFQLELELELDLELDQRSSKETLGNFQ